MTRWRSETTVRNRLVSRIEAVGGACELHTCPGTRGDPDVLCSLPWGYHCMVETKWAPGVPPDCHQLRRHLFWRRRGVDVWVASDDRETEWIVSYALRSAPLSVDRYAILDRSPAVYARGRPRAGEDRDDFPGAGPIEDGRLEL